MLEETLRKSMSQQSQDAQFQQNVDVKNQQLEAQIAKAQLEKAESDSKLSIQNEQLEQLRAHCESNRIRELSLLQASQALQASQPGGMAPAHPSYEWHKQKPPESGLTHAGGNPLTRTDEPKPSAWQPTSVPSQPELRNQAGGNPKCEAEKEKEKPRLFAPSYNMAQDDHEYWTPYGSENQSRHKESESCRFDY